ncbi:succinate dehydrogenase assembly factor 2 [Candidatus Marimicrobium litorale]|jgi:antitoxin CptB|uniref:FAD assembly factor SdhE n=1 Tax=Candidatus Marimicrobium litorale TaxID=2518991 RepID=A0ABT3T495_9GAMM|nr:succinate dehydrogenase assembly factor 2 [Candidatus Marimicrobium litorale]MCX2976640.1 succinate dehydrogenase assembly factor 2 family protein [Candidatus Marimicrobium litorale]
MIDQEEVRRMQWAARRGMLELDLVLEPFVNQRYSELSDSDRAIFQRLMLREDQELFSWLLQREAPEDKELAAIIKQILKFARTVPADR